MGTHEGVNPESCYVTLIYNKLVSLDEDLKWLYRKRVEGDMDYNEERLSNSIKYFTNEKRFWIGELKKYLEKLEY